MNKLRKILNKVYFEGYYCSEIVHEDVLKRYLDQAEKQIKNLMLNEKEIEETIKNTSLTAYEFSEPHPNKNIKYLSGSSAPGKLAKAIIKARKKKIGGDKR